MIIRAIYKETYLKNLLKSNMNRLYKIELPNNTTQRTVYNKASYVIWVSLAV